MDSPTKEQLIHQLCVALFGERPQNALRGYDPYLDISRPNFHDSKREFLLELETVEAVITHCEGIFERLIQDGDKASDEHKAMVKSVSDAVNRHSSQSLAHKKNLATASDLAVRNIIDSGFYLNSIIVTFYMSDAYQRRLIELKQQEAAGSGFLECFSSPAKLLCANHRSKVCTSFCPSKRNQTDVWYYERW